MTVSGSGFVSGADYCRVLRPTRVRVRQSGLLGRILDPEWLLFQFVFGLMLVGLGFLGLVGFTYQ